jgi:hypothetical protein
MAGFINPAIYTIGKGASYSSSFHDITTGNNTSSSSPNNYYAVTGYDLCTGWGTPMGQSLINAVVGAPDSLGIAPSAGFTSIGAVGGPFSPNTQTFVLTNTKSSSLTWSIVNSASWLEATPTNGVLAAYATTNVTVGLSAAADDLAAGIYTANMTFTNWTTHIAQGESFSLQIGQSLVDNGGFETGDFTGLATPSFMAGADDPLFTTPSRTPPRNIASPIPAPTARSWATTDWQPSRKIWLPYPAKTT